jgi:hypothetical protein
MGHESKQENEFGSMQGNCTDLDPLVKEPKGLV